VKEPPFLVKIGIDIESKEERWFKKAGKASADGGSIALSLSRLFQSRFSVNRGEELHPRLPNQTYDYFIFDGDLGKWKTAVPTLNTSNYAALSRAATKSFIKKGLANQ
jgi:hypothetical protein